MDKRTKHNPYLIPELNPNVCLVEMGLQYLERDQLILFYRSCGRKISGGGGGGGRGGVIVSLHMTGYAPVYTKSVGKGSFFDIRWHRRLLQKGYNFRC